MLQKVRGQTAVDTLISRCMPVSGACAGVLAGAQVTINQSLGCAAHSPPERCAQQKNGRGHCGANNHHAHNDHRNREYAENFSTRGGHPRGHCCADIWQQRQGMCSTVKRVCWTEWQRLLADGEGCLVDCYIGPGRIAGHIVRQEARLAASYAAWRELPLLIIVIVIEVVGIR